MEECIICFEENPKFLILQCNHKLCETCFFLVQENTNACPLCNRALVLKQYHHVPCGMLMCIFIWVVIFILCVY
jgi:hypothetical protein